MPSLDAFSTHGAFNMRSLTDAVNKMPYVPGRVGSLGIFDERGITTSGVMVEEKDGVLSLVQSTPRGGVAVQQGVNKRTARTFETRRLCLTRNINVDEILNLRAFGSENALADLESFVQAELGDMIPSVDMTLEHMMLGALKGLIKDADGTTIYDLFSEFGVSQEPEVAFNFALPATQATLTTACNKIVRTIQDNLGANTMNIRVHAFCSSTFWDEFTGNSIVNSTFERAMGVHTLADQIGGFQRESHVREAPFYWKGIYWEEYRGQLGGTTFVPADKAIFFPVNVPGLYRVYYAPADFEGGQGMGRPRYARRLPTSQDGRSVPLEVSSYPLAMCLRPKVLMLGKRGA
jgi:hypothetical protein